MKKKLYVLSGWLLTVIVAYALYYIMNNVSFRVAMDISNIYQLAMFSAYASIQFKRVRIV